MTLEQRAQAHYPNHPTYQAAWLKMVAFLGDRWLLARHISRSS